MKVERRCILQGISLSDLKVKACLAYSHCLWNARLHFDLSILQIFSWVCTRPHAVCSYLTLFQATNLLSLAYRLSVQDIFFFFYFFFYLQKHLLKPAHCSLLRFLSFPFKTGGCDVRMWVLWSGQVSSPCRAMAWDMAPWQCCFLAKLIFFPVPGRKLTA